MIVSDLDGTLLPPDKKIPEETFGLISELADNGIIFAPASGRQLPNLKKLFSPVLDKIAIIAENGGLAWYGGEIIFADPTPAESVKYALNILRRHEGLFPLLSCTDCAYYDSDDQRFIGVLTKSYNRAERTDDLFRAAEEHTVLKISVWDEKPCAEHGGVILPPEIKGLRTMISGYDWLDVSVLGANKGKALLALASRLKVNAKDTVAFGDHMNDLEMLEAAGRAYVTANAFPALKSRVGEVIPSNAEYGVITKLKEILQSAKNKENL